MVKVRSRTASTASAVGGGVVGGTGVGSLVANLRLEHSEPYASVVLALTPTTLYLLGRHRVGPLASFADMAVIAKIAREHAHADLSQAGVLKHLTIVNDVDGAEYVYEVKPLGSGVGSVVRDLGNDAS